MASSRTVLRRPVESASQSSQSGSSRWFSSSNLAIMFGRPLILASAPLVHQGSLSILNTLLVCSSLAVSAAGAQEPAETSLARTYHYDQWDVFTDEPLTGNQLAVFMEPQGLTTDLMQSIAREMSFSETTFIFPPDDEDADFRVRIFGPNWELPFAGHPTIGTAFALARAGAIAPGTAQVVFSEGIGPVIVELEWNGDGLRFAWMHDITPKFGKTLQNVNSMAVALGVKPSELKSTLLPVQEVSGGASFLFIPLTSRAVVDRARLNTSAISTVLQKAGLAKQSVFMFSTEPTDDGATVYGRKLGLDGREDPATGSAAGPLGCYLVRYGVARGKESASILIRQGVQMGRPSWLHVQLGLSGNEITDVRVGGSSVFIGDGTIMLPDD
ncbi:MAG: PhzF family phenazine biosynthesis protein [Chromatiales bacterium]|nr:MAG: PhzF family phenazine biosynthesis protein [Chromatiales bacterium]